MICEAIKKVNSDQASVIAEYDKYVAGEQSYEEWIMYLICTLNYYIKGRISKQKRTLGAEYDDLMQAGYLAVIEKAKDYNPHISTPVTFFTEWIDQYQRDCFKLDGTTKYYNSVKVRLDKAARENGYEGVTDEHLTDDTLSVISGISIRTVVETRKCCCTNTISLDVMENNVDIEDIVFKNPEKVYVDNELSEFVEMQLAKCTKLERWLLERVVLTGSPASYRSLVSTLKKPEAREEFGSELPRKIEEVFIKQKVAHALRRIKASTETRGYIFGDEDIVDECYTQMLDEDIAEVFTLT